MRTAHENAPQQNQARGYGVALVSAVVLSSTAIFIRYLTRTYGLPPLVLAFWRDLFVVATLLPALLIVRPGLLRLRSRDLGHLLAYGLMLAGFNCFLTLSVALNGAAAATVLVYCSAPFTALLGRWLLKEPLGWGKASAIIVALAGCVLVSEAFRATAWNSNPVGIVAGVLAGLGYAAYSLMGRSASEKGLNPWTTLLYTFSFAAVFLLILNLLPGGHVPGSAARAADLFWLGRSRAGWGYLILLAAGPTVLGFGLYNVSLTYLPSSVANLVVMTEVVFTAVIAYLALGERLAGHQILGGLFILGGVLLLRLAEKAGETGLVRRVPISGGSGCASCAINRTGSSGRPA
jgi:drug/metabolite transporter (DMT)-like permease